MQSTLLSRDPQEKRLHWSCPPFNSLIARIAGLLLIAHVAGCTHLPPTDPPPAFLLSWLDANAAQEVHAFERSQGRVRIDSPYLSGTFTSALVRRRGVDPAVRLQLYPELGGRVLDLAATPYGFEGVIPPANIRVTWNLEDGKPPRHFFAFLAASLMEEGTPLSADRALGAAPAAGHSWRVGLTPNFEGLQVIATLNAHGVLQSKEYSLRKVTWTQAATGQRHFEGRDFRMTILEETTTASGPLADALFRLEPQGTQGDASSDGQ